MSTVILREKYSHNNLAKEIGILHSVSKARLSLDTENNNIYLDKNTYGEIINYTSAPPRTPLYPNVADCG
jgi:hypothetical protein